MIYINHLQVKSFILLFLVVSVRVAFSNHYCVVIGITDGDTIKCVTEDKTLLKVRLDQIDAPEKKAAKQHLADLIFQRTVTLDDKGRDRYKRIIAEVYLDGININKQMVVDGYAWAFIKYVRDRDYYVCRQRLEKTKKGCGKTQTQSIRQTIDVISAKNATRRIYKCL